MSIFKHHIPIDRRIPFADNLAHAINEYWRMQVAVPDGSRSAYEGDVFMKTTYGIPVQVQQKRMAHPAIIRVRRGPNNKWFITDQEDK